VAEQGARTSRSTRIVLAALVVLIVALVTFLTQRASPDVVDFGTPPGPSDAPAPGVRALTVDPESAASAPPVGAVLVDGGWDAVSGFVAARAAEGRPTLVNFFASWCPPCIREMPLLTAAADTELGVAFLGVAHMDARADAEGFVAQQDVRFTTVLDLDGEAAFTVGGRGLPITLVFDRDGRMVGRVYGELTEASLEDLLALVR
jgi:cytochrome c biogenesis protein CcmG, thiol:disulfide interchange protein DsbE